MSSIFGAIRTALGGDNRPLAPVVDPAVTPLTPEQEAAMYPEPDWLQTGAAWPPADIRKHIEMCEENDDLFGCDFHQVFALQYERLKELENYFAPTTYEQEVNLFHALTMLWRALLTAEPPQFTAGEPGSPESKAVQRLVTDTKLVSSLKMGVIDQSAKAAAVFVAGIDPRIAKVCIDVQPPERWYPFVDPGNVSRKLADVLFYEEKAREGNSEVRYLNAAIHYPGLIKHRRYRIKDGKLVRVDAVRRPFNPATGELVLEDQSTGITSSLVSVAYNIRQSNKATGISDYNAIETIVPELSVRASQWAKLFDKFTDPMAYGPRIDAQENPATGEAEIKVRGRYIHMEQGDPTPGYAVWDPQLQHALAVWDKLMDVYFVATGTTREAFQIGQQGRGATSGTALKLMLMRPLQVAADKAQEFDQAIGDVLLAAQQLEIAHSLAEEQYEPSRPRITWRDGLPQDPKEQADIENLRTGNKPTTSTLSAIKRLDDLTDEEAQEELDRIQAEQEAAIPATGAVDLNGPDGQVILEAARKLMADDPTLSEAEALQQAQADLQQTKPGAGQ